MVEALRRRFEMLRAHRVVLRRQEDGDEIDTDAAIEARADVRAGAAMPERLYRSARLTRRDAAVLVLVDASGSTDAWIAGRRRIIDVEREALLLLSIALDGTGDPHAIVSFSGEGPQHVTVRMLKRFGEHHHQAVSLRIAGVEPERYTRAGAALRHASQLLQAQQANHRLLLLLSDGKPNDRDEYDGRYGIEDMRQAVLEARAMGLSPFCLTVDRQAAAYLPRVFGPHHHALLPQTQRLPAVLLEWIRRLLTR
jgi:nitric oxide reductase NorD protein